LTTSARTTSVTSANAGGPDKSSSLPCAVGEAPEGEGLEEGAPAADVVDDEDGPAGGGTLAKRGRAMEGPLLGGGGVGKGSRAIEGTGPCFPMIFPSAANTEACACTTQVQ